MRPNPSPSCTARRSRSKACGAAPSRGRGRFPVPTRPALAICPGRGLAPRRPPAHPYLIVPARKRARWGSADLDPEPVSRSALPNGPTSIQRFKIGKVPPAASARQGPTRNPRKTARPDCRRTQPSPSPNPNQQSSRGGCFAGCRRSPGGSLLREGSLTRSAAGGGARIRAKRKAFRLART